MTAASYLRKLKNMDHLISGQEELIESLKLSVSKMTASYSDMPRCGRITGIDDLIVKLETQIEKVIELRNQNIDLRTKIIKQLNQMESSTDKAILLNYYVNGYTVQAVANKLEEDYTTIYRKKELAEQRFYEKFLKSE